VREVTEEYERPIYRVNPRTGVTLPTESESDRRFMTTMRDRQESITRHLRSLRSRLSQRRGGVDSEEEFDEEDEDDEGGTDTELMRIRRSGADGELLGLNVSFSKR